MKSNINETLLSKLTKNKPILRIPPDDTMLECLVDAKTEVTPTNNEGTEEEQAVSLTNVIKMLFKCAMFLGAQMVILFAFYISLKTEAQCGIYLELTLKSIMIFLCGFFFMAVSDEV